MSNSDEGRELDTVLAEYLEAAAAGLAPDREELIRTHHHLADDLRHFFEGEDAIEGITAPLRPSPESWPHIPGYEILGEQGRGGMGVVYKARQLSLNRVVALKMILSGAHAAPAARDRFVSEAQAVARLKHPNIVPVYEVGTHEGLSFFSMELCEGGSLADLVSRGATAPADAARVVETVARAVHVCHGQHIIHRDLKPANVLLTTDGTLKVSDFGLAKDLDADSRTSSSAVVGTPCYMAPEQAAGRRDRIGPATDVYALGAMLYELLTGQPPFHSTTPVATVLRVVSEEPTAPRGAGTAVPRDLATICMKCLNKEPARRYQTALELAEDLQRFQRGEPVQARPVGQAERLWRWCRRNPAVAALLTAVAMALMIGTAVATVFAIRAEEETGRARQAEATAVEEGEHAKQEWTRAEQEAARARQEGEHAKEEWRRAEGLLYSTQIAQAQRAWQDHNAADAWHYLGSTRADLRGWEYRHLHTLLTKNQRTFLGHTKGVYSVCFSPDGKRLASASWDQTVRVWDAEKGHEVHVLKGHTEAVTAVAFSPDGKHLASASYDGTVKVWDAQTGQDLLTLKGHTGPVNSVCFSPDSEDLASASEDETVKVWNARTGQDLFSLKGHNGPVLSVCFSPDGRRLASASADQTVKVWDAQTGLYVLNLYGHFTVFTSVCFSPDGKHLASANDDKTVKVLNVQTGQEVLTLKGHTDDVTSVCFSPDGKHLATASYDKTVKVWDARGQDSLTPTWHTKSVTSVCFSPDGNRLAGARYRTVKVWDVQTGQDLLTLKGHTDPVSSVCFSPDGKRLASASSDKTMRLWDADTGQEVRTLKGHTYSVEAVTFSPDGKRLASASGGNLLGNRLKPGEVKVWDAQTGQDLLTLKGHTSHVTAVAFSPDGKLLASASWDQTVRLWNADTGQEVRTLKGHTHFVEAVTFSPDGKRLASASYDGTVKVWDAQTGQDLLTLKGHASAVLAVAFSPDGKRLASASDDQTVKIWDAQMGQDVLTLKGHTGPVRSVCFSPDGKRLASASCGSGWGIEEDGEVKVWDAETD